ncbi:AraC family transcriptional regulator [Chroococcidiopsis sp.]|uniref:helix-turn-helix domain-containing protein n=1 Tax=Chroococcidiopsis sp. TaxID=3088168 RepID=UPI003F2F8B85
MRSTPIHSVKPDEWLNKSLVLSSQQMDWNGILVQQFQSFPTSTEVEIPALSNHWLNLPLGQPVRLTQKRDDRLHDSIVQKGDCIFVPAGQPSYWHCWESVTYKSMLHIHLKPELVAQVAETSDLNGDRIDLVNCFSKPDLQLQQIAMLLLAELKSDSIMGRLYVESLTQALIIHLLRHYSAITQTITPKQESLTRTQLRKAIDYIHAHLDRDLSLAEIAGVVNISPTYFASLFKHATDISPHQYVIGQRVERAKLMLSKTDLAIADIALQVGFSSQSHLTQQFKRFTGMTPKQVR